MRCELVKTALGVRVLDCLEHTFTAQTPIGVCSSLQEVLLDQVNLRHSQTVLDNHVIARIIQETVRHSHAHGAPSAGNPIFLQGLVNAV
jgi:hypothetical protein